MTSFSDDFNRADSTDLGAGWVEVSGDWSIVSNQLSPGSAGGTIILRAATAMATNDNYAQITITATAALSQGVWCRGNSNISQGYLWRNNGTSWDLFQVVGGSFTNIGTFAGAAAINDIAKVEAIGTAIKGYVNGVVRVSVTDSGVTTGTSVGVRSESSASLRYDDFSAADASASVTGTATSAFGSLTATASGTPTVRATATATFGALAATASGVPKVLGTAAASFGGLTAAASGTPKVIGSAGFSGGALTASSSGVPTVVASAGAQLGSLTGSATVASHVTGTATAEFSALTATAQGGVPAAATRGSWWSLRDIVYEAALLRSNELQRDPVACLDCGEPLRLGPRAELYCPVDGWIWAAGNRRIGRVETTRIRRSVI